MPHEFYDYAAGALVRAGVPKEDIRVTPFGVRVMTEDVDAVRSCRVYDRLYFTVPIKKGEKLTADRATETIATSMLKRILDTYIEGTRPIPVRIKVELYGASDKKDRKKAEEAKRLTGVFSNAVEKDFPEDIEVVSNNYECEIYLPMRPDKSFGFYLWIACMGDKRFSYRKAVEPASMSPARSATMMEMVHEYLIGEDSVLDPFCGTGTLLIERKKYARCGNVFGTDISKKMIDGARENAACASENIHFIQRDFFDFTYEGVFDEIITELPDLYHRDDNGKMDFMLSFIKKCMTITASGSLIMVLTGDTDIFSSVIKGEKELKTAERKSFGKKREVFILRRI